MMKTLPLFRSFVVFGSLLAIAANATAAPRKHYAFDGEDPYQKQLNRLRDEMTSFGISLDVFGDNPFQTGTSLSNNYLNEKTLLLEEKSFFQTKSNDLSSTDALADLQYRNKVLRTHANNILIQLSQAIRGRKDEGFMGVEAPKHKATLEQIIADCQKNAECVAKRLANPQTAVENVLVDNLQAAADIFARIPYMQSIEVMSAYQLTQMLYLEVFKNQARGEAVEYSLYYDKEADLAKRLKKDPTLTEKERATQIAMTSNVINKWKKRIMDRVGDTAKAEFLKKSNEMRAKNQRLANAILGIRKDNAAVIGSLYDPKRCRGLLGARRRKWCQGQDYLQEIITQTSANQGIFVDASGNPVSGQATRLPDDFFKPFN